MLQTESIFKELVVVELAAVLAGPSVGMFFGELGAKVIKVENKATGGDITRRWKVGEEDPGVPVSAYYSSVNFFKEVVFADLKEPGDREKILDIIAKADVVIANFKKGSAEKLGMDYPSLSKINKKLIYACVEGLSEGDPRPAFDVVLQAETGFLSMTGTPDGEYAKMPVALIDLLAAHQLKQGILIALLKRAASGHGYKVKASLIDSGLASLANQGTNWLMAGHLPAKMGTMHPNIAPYGDLFTSKDGVEFVLAVGTEKQWASLCSTFGIRGEIKGWPNDIRVAKREMVINACQWVFGEINSATLFKKMNRAGIPWGKLKNVAEALKSKAASGMLIEEEQEGVKKKGLRSVVFSIEEYSAQ